MTPFLFQILHSNIGGITLECIIWLLVDANWSAASGSGLGHIRLQHFHTISDVKCCSVMWFGPGPGVALLFVSAGDQMTQSNFGPPIKWGASSR